MAVNRENFLKVFDERIDGEDLFATYEYDAQSFLPKLQNNNFPIYGLI